MEKSISGNGQVKTFEGLGVWQLPVHTYNSFIVKSVICDQARVQWVLQSFLFGV